MSEVSRPNNSGPRRLSGRTHQRIENYLANMRRSGLKRDVRIIVASIEGQYRTNDWLSIKQIDLLRRCCIASNASNRGGGFSGGPCFGRNAPAGRGRGPVG